jgi:hypothetical protein
MVKKKGHTARTGAEAARPEVSEFLEKHKKPKLKIARRRPKLPQEKNSPTQTRLPTMKTADEVEDFAETHAQVGVLGDKKVARRKKWFGFGEWGPWFEATTSSHLCNHTIWKVRQNTVTTVERQAFVPGLFEYVRIASGECVCGKKDIPLRQGTWWNRDKWVVEKTNDYDDTP